MSTFLSNPDSKSHTIVLLVVTDSNLVFKHPFKTEDGHSGNCKLVQQRISVAQVDGTV